MLSGLCIAPLIYLHPTALDLTLKQDEAVNLSNFSVTDQIAMTIKIPLISAAASDHLWLSL